MLSLKRYDRGAELDARGVRGHQRHHRQSVEIVGYLRHPGSVQACRLGPFDIGHQLGYLARHVAAFGPDHHAQPHASSPAFSVSARTSRTRVSSGVPVGNTAAAPADISLGTSASGMVPPTTTAISPASAARNASTVRVVSATCAPDRMLNPTGATSSCIAIDTMSSMR